MSKNSPWRSSFAVRLFLVATLAAAAFLGAYGLLSPNTGSTNSQSSAPEKAEPSAEPEVVAFTSAESGTCLSWDIDGKGEISNFAEISCDKPHRFEVAAREDLSTYPTSEFGPDAERPDVTRQNALRDELCESSTLGYLHGKWDPNGKFDIASVLPPQAAWQQGDRTLLCGLQTTDEAGVPQLNTGNVEAVDQAVVAKPGECRSIDDKQVVRTVDCAQPHQLETVSIVNLGEHFTGGYPNGEELDSYLNETCTAAAIEYLGEEENLYQSTLQPFWGSVNEAAWNGGSRSVNCSLMHPNDGHFSTITGSATGGRNALTIDGAPPAVQPERNPVRNPSAAPSPAPNAQGAPADNSSAANTPAPAAQ